MEKANGSFFSLFFFFCCLSGFAVSDVGFGTWDGIAVGLAYLGRVEFAQEGAWMVIVMEEPGSGSGQGRRAIGMGDGSIRGEVRWKGQDRGGGLRF